MKQNVGSILTTQSEGVNSTIIGGAALLATLSASCCLLPLGLSIVGLGGAWLTFLEPFVRYREFILIAVAIVIALSWLRLWRSPGDIRGNRRGAILTPIATVVFLVALSASYWENEIARSLWNILRQQS